MILWELSQMETELVEKCEDLQEVLNGHNNLQVIVARSSTVAFRGLKRAVGREDTS